LRVYSLAEIESAGNFLINLVYTNYCMDHGFYLKYKDSSIFVFKTDWIINIDKFSLIHDCDLITNLLCLIYSMSDY
jgi:hypothetical protein